MCLASLGCAQTILTADGLAAFVGAGPSSPATVQVMNYMAFTNQPPGTQITDQFVISNTIPGDSGNFDASFSPNAPGQFIVWTNGPAFQTPIQIGNSIYYGTEAQSIQLSNDINYSTIELSMPPDNDLPWLSVSGFVMVPGLTNAVATMDLIVLGCSRHEVPYDAEDWTLQLNCNSINLIQFEDAGGGVVAKLAPTPYPSNRWLFFTMSVNTTNGTEYGAVYDTATWSLLTSCTNEMELTNTFVDYWLFGNNEAGSCPGFCLYYSGLYWANTPPSVSTANARDAEIKFYDPFFDSNPFGNHVLGAGAYNFVTGANGVSHNAHLVAHHAGATSATRSPPCAGGN